MKKESKLVRDSVVIGLALFSMFFGAGSLIFPPYLGMESGTGWFLGFICFILADIGLAFVTIVAMINGDGSISSITGVVGKIPALVINTAVIICIGPFLAIPRTAATTYEMSVLPVTSGINITVFSVIYFAIAWVLTIRPSRVVDILGKFLTPALVICLAVLIIAGIIWPLGEITEPVCDNIVREGVLNGYQAMDVLGALGFAIIIIGVTREKGYTEPSQARKAAMISCILAGGALFLVYCGITYLGATASSVYDIEEVNQASLLVHITEDILGFEGVIILGIVVGLACLTTAVGLTAAAAKYFEGITGGRLKYEVVVTLVMVFSVVVSNFGLSAIISIATPVLSVVYPTVVTLIILSFFKRWISNLNIYRGAALVSFTVSFLTVLTTYGVPVPLVNSLPLADYGFNWVLPTAAGGLIGAFVRGRKKDLTDSGSAV